jgi:hypothetical protein
MFSFGQFSSFTVDIDMENEENDDAVSTIDSKSPVLTYNGSAS